ncbi:MAG: hypothetical protein JO202_16895 [Ktedonobacteraceae bacterium]|nr:hypothetical protein [Ktedonobacteraceae bacterium]
MRLQLVASVIAACVVAGGVLGIVLLSSPFLSGMNNASALPALTTQANTGNPIVRENAHPGTSTWQIPVAKVSVAQIQAYANSTYVLPGKSIKFYVSTQEEGKPYSLCIYRLGWYGGLGGRLMAFVNNLVGHAQGVYDLSKHTLVGCISCVKNAQTDLLEAHWQASYTLTVPADWTTGVYLAKFIDLDGMQTYVPFDVLEVDSSSTYIVVTPDTTYAAYNNWGGASLYEADETTNAAIPSESDVATKGTKVSFDRPYAQDAGASQVLIYEADAIRWMERQGYDLTYASDVNLHQLPDLLSHHKAYISLGHDEYWTKEMRDQVERARDKGVGIAFLGADAVYWQMRFEPDSDGVPNRTVVCYKVQTGKDLARDPFYGKGNTQLTAQWRDPVLGRPENALVGIMFSDLTHKRAGYSWRVDPAAKTSLLNETGLQPGQEYGCGLVGYEWDRVFNNGSSPPNLHVIATSIVHNDLNSLDSSNTAYYIAQSGAMVFASGSIYWATALDSYREQSDAVCGNQNRAILGIQVLMAHVMDNLIVPHSVK